jgi:S1-C subfamily serine protease
MYFGNSGGGAFNDYGELVGIADWIKRAPEMGFFVHLDTIRSFLDTNLKK